METSWASRDAVRARGESACGGRYDGAGRVAGARWAAWLYFGFWAVGAVLMIVVYSLNPPDPALVGTAAYGHTKPGEIPVLATFTSFEVLLFSVLLRPWSYHRSWGRSLLSLAFLAPWLVLCGVMTMHSGPTSMLHLGWVVLFGIGLIISLGVAILRRS